MSASTADLPHGAASRSTRRRLPWWAEGWTPAVVVFLGTLAITFLLWRDMSERVAASVAARFEYRTDRIRGELDHRLDGYEAALRSVAGVIGARPTFDRASWRRYFEHAVISEEYPGRLVIGYAQRVPNADRANHEQIARNDGEAGYAVRSRGADARGEAVPMAYERRVAPVSPIPLGDDLADDPVAADAMRRSAAENQIVLAGPLSWSKSPAEADQVWALFVPVFGGAATPTTPPERQAAIIGWLIEAFNPMETTGSTLGPDAKLIGLKVVDSDLPLFTCPEMQQQLSHGFQPTLTRETPLVYGGRTWMMRFVALPGFHEQLDASAPRTVLVGGVLVSALLAALVGTLGRRRVRAESLVQERTQELSLALRRSEANESRVRAVVDHALDAIITIDDRGHVQSFNPAAERMFGYRESEVVGRNVSMLMPGTDHARHDGYLENYQRTGERRIIGVGREVSALRADGTVFPIELGISEMTLDGKRCYCGIVRDVTQRREAEAELLRERESLERRVQERTEVLAQANTELEQQIRQRHRVEVELVAAREQALQAAEAKAGFLANMSHEIRTPMNAVIGMTALLEETPLTGEQRSCVETIRVSGDALLALINDILDFSKIESGMLELEHRPFELGVCIEEAFDMLAPRAAEKGIDLLYVLDDDVPRWIAGDAARLRQVFVNLLSNAVKFTPHGEVCLSASVSQRERDRAVLRFAVRDTGIGIPIDKRDHLFKAFTQADSSTTRKYGGTGLGLAICQRLVQLMGGEIEVDSAEGQGSTFSFTMRTEVAAGTATHSRYVSEAVAELVGKRVLLVDDNATNLHILQAQCRRWGMDVKSASGGAEALALLDRDRMFDVAVLDLHMPSMDGVQLAQQIRWLCPGTMPALVLLSSTAQRRAGVAGDALFSAQLSKPVKHTQLFQVLCRVLLGDAGTMPSADGTRRLDRSLAQRLPLRILVAEDSHINQKLAVGILSKLGYTCDVAANGAEALELMRIHRYDLVFMDLQMPEMDGLEATRRIVAERPAGERPRIVAMTANALAGDRERCLEAGMDDYIAKPILPVDVQAIIERLARGAPSASASAHESPLVDERIVRELRALDDPDQPQSLLRDLLRDYLTEAPASIGDIKHHADRREATHVAKKAHKLAGVSASLGAAGMADVCQRIEQQVVAGELTSLPALVDQLELRFARTRAELQRLV